MKSLTVWYISKYVTPPRNAKVGARGFFLLEELVKMGQSCLLVTSDSNHLAEIEPMAVRYMDESCNGVQVRWVRTCKYGSARDWRRILSWMHFEWRVVRMPTADLPRPDVVIASSLSILSIFSGLYYRWKFGAKLIFEVRDIWPLVLVEEGGLSRWNPFVIACGIVERFAYRMADEIIGTMPNLSAHVAEALGFPKAAKCIPMGVDPSTMQAGEPLPEAYIATHIPKGAFIVCHAGTIGVTNALDTLFECARMMREDRQVRFLVVGDGYMKAHYQAATADLGNVIFAPRIPKSMVQSLLAEVDVVYFAAHPSKVLRYGQSLNKVVDYMLSGKPVLASYSGYPSMIDESGCGTFVPAGESAALTAEIRRMQALPNDERIRMGAKGRAWILEKRHYAVLAAEYLNILRSLSHRPTR
jgi:glycosyltransferase involved in cell wall biosynthesis